VIVAANVCFEPVVATLLRRELGTRAAAAHGDTVTPVLARAETQEWEWARAWSAELVRFLLADSEHGEHNRAVIGGWVRDWMPRALGAASALAPLADPLGIDVERSLARVSSYAGEMLVEAGLPECCGLVGYEPVATEGPRSQVRSVKSGKSASARQTESAPSTTSAEDYVGIVMAKSAEGDAVATVLGRRGDVEVLEQRSFWDIRAPDRLVIAYDEVSEQLGYEIDAYSIQHEMSTHYGRMVATDDSLMLFSDPTEAMEHLLS
jgi:propane monooxygenase coupling protein